MKSYLKNYRQSPRKVRLIADLIKGKGVERAAAQLKFVQKRASNTFSKLLDSAVSNAKENNSLDKGNLYIKDVRVDEGPTLKRIRARARGAAHPIRKRTSNITLVLDEKSKAKAKVNSKSETLKSKQRPKLQIRNKRPKA